MIAYKVVTSINSEYRSVMHRALVRNKLEHLSLKYKIGVVTHAPKTKVFNRIYCFDSFENARRFYLNNISFSDFILKCKVDPLKSVQLFDWDDILNVYKSGKLDGVRKTCGIEGTIPCKWVKPLELAYCQY